MSYERDVYPRATVDFGIQPAMPPGIEAPKKANFSVEIFSSRLKSLGLPVMFMRTCVECTSLFITKSETYGKTNISDQGEDGVLKRIREKTSRLLEYLDTGVWDEEEPPIETWKDILTLGGIGCMVHRKQWPMPKLRSWKVTLSIGLPDRTWHEDEEVVLATNEGEAKASATKAMEKRLAGTKVTFIMPTHLECTSPEDAP